MQPARQPRAPVHRGRAVREGQRLPRAHAARRPAAVPAAARRRARARARFERISWDEALAEIAARLHAVRDEFGGEAIWPFQGTGSLGYVQGLEGRAGQRLWNVLGASRHDMTICSVAGRVGATYTTGTAAGMDPETFAHSKLILLWGTNTLTSGHHLWKFILAARKNGAHVVAIDPLRTRTAGAGRRAPRAAARHRRRARARAAARGRRAWAPRTATYLARAHRRLGGVPGADPRVPAVARGRAHRPRRRSGSSRSGERLATTRPTGIRCTMGMQRHAGGGNALRLLYALPGVTGDWQYPGGGASYSTSGHFKAERRRHPPRRPARAPGADAEHDPARRGPARPRRPAGQGARRLRRQPDGLQPRPEARRARVWSARTCSRS